MGKIYGISLEGLNYEIDDDESKHTLSLNEYGQTDETNAWVLLQAEK